MARILICEKKRHFIENVDLNAKIEYIMWYFSARMNLCHAILVQWSNYCPWNQKFQFRRSRFPTRCQCTKHKSQNFDTREIDPHSASFIFVQTLSGSSIPPRSEHCQNRLKRQATFQRFHASHARIQLPPITNRWVTEQKNERRKRKKQGDGGGGGGWS